MYAKWIRETCESSVLRLVACNCNCNQSMNADNDSFHERTEHPLVLMQYSIFVIVSDCFGFIFNYSLSLYFFCGFISKFLRCFVFCCLYIHLYCALNTIRQILYLFFWFFFVFFSFYFILKTYFVCYLWFIFKMIVLIGISDQKLNLNIHIHIQVCMYIAFVWDVCRLLI